MTPSPVTGAQVLAARALVGISRVRLSARAGVDRSVIEEIEDRGLIPLDETDDLRKLVATLEEIGAVFIEEAGGLGPGVRVRFSRGAARAIDRWEAEGGVPADDDIL